METIYKPIVGFPNYLVGNDGSVVNMNTGDRVFGSEKRTGYTEVCLLDGAHNRKYALVHRLVAVAFCHKENEDDEVNHKDGNKANNAASNLEWVTHADNLRHAYEMGLRKDDVSPRTVIATDIENGEEVVFESIYKAARFLGISQGNICMACKGERAHAGGYLWRYAE